MSKSFYFREKEYKPSRYQWDIFDKIKDGDGNIIVSAVAGSGKTTTLVWGATLIDTDGIFVAFNKHIADELDTRLKGTRMFAKTVHALGKSSLSSVFGSNHPQVDTKKYFQLCREWIERNTKWSPRDVQEAVPALKSLVDMCRLQLVDPSSHGDVWAVANRHGYDVNNEIVAGVLPVIEAGTSKDYYFLPNGSRKPAAVIDFVDMLWLPVMWDLPMQKYGWMFCDEAQDFSRLMQAVVKKAVGGRVLLVGDRNQSIMGFAGADTKSFDTLKTEFNAVEFPLSICYRCPKSHVELAKQLVPEIEPREDAPEGLITKCSKAEMYKNLKAGDMGICRLTAPLISACINSIKMGIPACVRGRDIGGQIVGTAKKIYKLCKTFSEFSDNMAVYYLNESNRLAGKQDAESRLQSLKDQIDAMDAIIEANPNITSVEALCKYIESLFSDDIKPIVFSTVHRAKGLEADRVFIISPKLMPLKYVDPESPQFQQELNIKYVAHTRAKKELFFVE